MILVPFGYQEVSFLPKLFIVYGDLERPRPLCMRQAGFDYKFISAIYPVCICVCICICIRLCIFRRICKWHILYIEFITSLYSNSREARGWIINSFPDLNVATNYATSPPHVSRTMGEVAQSYDVTCHRGLVLSSSITVCS